ncbi:AAA family ATPase [Exiguobacterium chiriqhucha]|uniref:Uncharacterized protein n=1 Tax=Exiguobacterium chiriqhucha RW-2 TaxID=1345023 RepID=U1N3C5_9BACL|nr:AAA family ATPase [Exiguobacterium chiriqhucha]ERG68411.1 hypothetical protein M467_14115 [Exiguobacterium chiriqhucha RW-2]
MIYVVREELLRYVDNMLEITNSFKIITDWLIKEKKEANTLNLQEIPDKFYVVKITDSQSKLVEIEKEIKKTSVDSDEYITYIHNKLETTNWASFTKIRDMASFCEGKEIGKDVKYSEIEKIEFIKVLNHFVPLINEIINRISAISLYTKIHKIENNIVIIGRNGSGKSNFARELNGILADEMSIISAQRLLYYNPPSEISIANDYSQIIREFQSKSKLSKDDNYQNLVLDDFTNLLLALFEEKRKNVYKYYIQNKKSISVIDETIEIWEKICLDKKIIHVLDFELIVESESGEKYEFNMLSDGEKAVFYYIGHTLLAQKSGYILIDEPENHLHLSSCIKLWNILENKREDCKFIYITHNLEFATSRTNKTLIWNERYQPPFDWQFEIINDDQSIPERYLIEMLGSRKKIIFCEGVERKSLDYYVYSALFPEYHVIPVGGHKEVISYVRASKKNKFLSHIKVVGIIDGDFMDESKVEQYKKDLIFVLPFNEIENFFYSKEMLLIMIEETDSEEIKGSDAFGKFKAEFYKLLRKHNNELSLEYTRHKLNEYISSNSLTTKSTDKIEDLKNGIQDYFKDKNIDQIYEEYSNKIILLIEQDNFDELMRIHNLKRNLIPLGQRFIVENYEARVKILIQKNNPDKLKQIKSIFGSFYTDIANLK